MSKPYAEFESYREALGLEAALQGIEAIGVYNRDDYQRVTNDPLTIPIDTGAELLPYLTPVGNLPRVNNNLYSDNGVTGPSWFHCRTQLAQGEIDSTAALAFAQHQPFVLIEHSASEKQSVDRDLDRLSVITGASWRDHQLPDFFRHYQYYDRLVLNTAVNPDGTIDDLRAAYEAGLHSGHFDASSSVSATGVLGKSDIDHIWGYYEPAFDELSRQDPILAGSDKEELTDLLENPEFIKAVFRDSATGQVVNVSVYADVRSCEWMNQAFFEDQYPDEFHNGLAICSAGVLTDKQATTGLYSLQTLKMIAQLCEVAGVEPVLSFACDDISNNTNRIPFLAHTAVNRVRNTEINFVSPKNTEEFRAVQLHSL